MQSLDIKTADKGKQNAASRIHYAQQFCPLRTNEPMTQEKQMAGHIGHENFSRVFNKRDIQKKTQTRTERASVS